MHSERSGAIRKRLEEFEGVLRRGSDAEIWEEMVFCFFTGGCSARMGLRSIDAVRPQIQDTLAWQRVDQQVGAQSRQLADRINAPADLDVVAKENGHRLIDEAVLAEARARFGM